jgi:hypothetical protein
MTDDTAEPGRSRSGLLPVVAAALVIALAVTLTLVFGRSEPNEAGSSPASAVVGYRWRLTAVADSRGRLSVPAALHPWVGFSTDGTLRGDDTVNSYGGKYRLTEHGYSPTDVAGTLVGGTGGADSPRGRARAAVDAVLYPVDSGPPGATRAPELDVTASVAGDTLTLRARGVTLTLTRDGTQPNDSSVPSPTPTMTR